jgi:hypothetical protein
LDPRHRGLRILSRAARWAGLRLRIDETLARACLLLPLPLLYAVIGLTYLKLARPPAATEQLLRWGWTLPWLLVLLGVARCWWRPRPRELGSLALDRCHGLKGRITSALAFTRLPEREQTPLMRLAIADAEMHSGRLEPRRAAPLHLPAELPLVLFLLLGLVAVAVLEVRTVRELPAARAPEALLMSSDDIELFRQLSDELAHKSVDPETLAGVRQFNQLLEDLSERRLDRAEVFRRLGELERKMLGEAKADQESLGEGLKAVARELERSDLTKRAAQALDRQKLDDAEKALRELAERLKRPREKPSAAELARLREALRRASRANAERQARISAERQRIDEERKSLLKRKEAAKPSDARELNRAERQLERLDREKQQADRAQRQMSELDRKLAQAAEDLMKELGQGAQDLESAAQDINRMARDQMSNRDKQELLRRLRELKELLRQQGQGGQKQLERLQKFAERARGKQGESGQRGGAAEGRSQPGQGRGLVLGGQTGTGDQALLLERAGVSPGAGEQRGRAGESPPAGGARQGGREWGVGHDENLRGEKSELSAQTKDVSAAGIDTGEGASMSQVIMGAAQRGFVGRGYERVFQDYQTVAEQVMRQEEIPAGYRFYVQRYFQLIRPRE